MPLGALRDWGLVGHVQDEVEQSQLACFPGPLQPQERLVGMIPYVFSPPELEEPELRSRDWGMAQGIALELGLEGQGSGECGSQRGRAGSLASKASREHHTVT